MNAIPLLASQPWVERLGWTLVHFLWQGVLIAVLYAAARRWMFHSASPNARYVLGCGVLALMMAAPFVSFGLTHPSQSISISMDIASRLPASAAAAPTGAAAAASIRLSSGSGGLLPWVVVIWLAGAIVLWVRLMGSWIVAAGMRSTQARLAPPEWQTNVK